MDFGREIGELRAEIRSLQSLMERLMNLADDMIGMKGEHGEKFRNIEGDVGVIFKALRRMQVSVDKVDAPGMISKEEAEREIRDARELAESALRRVGTLEDWKDDKSNKRWNIWTIVISAICSGLATFAVAMATKLIG